MPFQPSGGGMGEGEGERAEVLGMLKDFYRMTNYIQIIVFRGSIGLESDFEPSAKQCASGSGE
jgi:hypothetical protein